MNSKNRMIYYLDHKSITQYDFSKKTGLSNGFLKSGKNITSDNMQLISSIYPDLNLIWLITGKGEMLKTEKKEVQATKPPVQPPATAVFSPDEHAPPTSYAASMQHLHDMITVYKEQIATLKEHNHDLKQQLLLQEDLRSMLEQQIRLLNDQLKNTAIDNS